MIKVRLELLVNNFFNLSCNFLKFKIKIKQTQNDKEKNKKNKNEYNEF
jgi:hypothetical protein